MSRLWHEFRLPLVAVCVVMISASASALRAADQAGAEVDARVARLIAQLGDNDYFIRERAQKELARIGFAAFDALEAAENHEDVEVAARAKYLVSQLQIEWTVDSDPPEVKELMKNRGKGDETNHLGLISQLIDLPHDKGLPVLCRLVRFDKSPLVSKFAALKIIEQGGITAPRWESREKVIEETIDLSPRPGAEWLRAYLVSRNNPAGGVEAWTSLADAEQRLLNQQSQLTRADIVRRVRRQQTAVLKRLDRRDDAVAAMIQIVDLEEGHSDTLVDLVNWLVQQQAWGVVDEVARRFRDRFDREAILLYTLAQAQYAQGHQEEAEKLAEKALSLADGASWENLVQHFESAAELQRRGMIAWCEREYRHVIKVGQSGETLPLYAQHRLSELLHDQGDDAGAAKICEESLQAREAREKENGGNVVELLGTIDTLRARTHFFRACTYEQAGDRVNQLAELKAGFESDPSEVDVLIALYRLPDLDDDLREKTRRAIQRTADDYRQKILEAPADYQPYNQFAWLVANTEGDKVEAKRASEKSLELLRSQPDERSVRSLEAGFLDTLARCHYANGDLEGAIEIQSRALEIDGHSGQMKKQLEQFKREAAAKKSAP